MRMRLIDAESLKELFPDNGEGSWTYNATAKAYIDAQPTIQPETNCSEIPNNWIPCSERLPEEYGEYLVTKHTIGWNCEEYDVNDIAYFDGDGFHKADRVIAWMPLPEPYQEGGQE